MLAAVKPEAEVFQRLEITESTVRDGTVSTMVLPRATFALRCATLTPVAALKRHNEVETITQPIPS